MGHQIRRTRQRVRNVVNLAGNCLGRTTRTLAMFACPVLEPTLTVNDAPLALLVFACVLTLNEGLNGRFAQPATANGLDTPALVF